MKQDKIYNIIYGLGLTVLYFLQETEKYNLWILLILTALFLGNIILKKKPSIKLPLYTIILALIYAFFIIEGLIYKHPNPTIDIKFIFFSYVLLLTFINREKYNYIRLFYIINGLTLIIYLLLKFNLMHSIWQDVNIGYKGRVEGPALIAFIFIAFHYLYHNKRFDKKVILAFIISVVYLLLAANFMNLLIVILLMTLIVVDLKKIFSVKVIGVAGVLLIGLIIFVNSDYVPPLVQKKLQYVSKPWEYPSFKIRIEDLKKAYKNEAYKPREILLGKGFGAHTSIYRENKIVSSFSRVFTFQEIDNGFYYLFHRGGLFLLFLFLFIHFLLLLKIPTTKGQLGFFIIITITNLLSIHYFNYYFYMYLVFYIFSSYYSRKLTFNKTKQNTQAKI